MSGLEHHRAMDAATGGHAETAYCDGWFDAMLFIHQECARDTAVPAGQIGNLAFLNRHADKLNNESGADEPDAGHLGGATSQSRPTPFHTRQPSGEGCHRQRGRDDACQHSRTRPRTMSGKPHPRLPVQGKLVTLCLAALAFLIVANASTKQPEQFRSTPDRHITAGAGRGH